MVTTIKITCDGVFIQSNPFFTNAHLRPAITAASVATDGHSSGSVMMAIEAAASAAGDELRGNGVIRAHAIGSGEDAGVAIDSPDADDGGGGGTVPVKNGNLTVVIRNNRRKIDRLALLGPSSGFDDKRRQMDRENDLFKLMMGQETSTNCNGRTDESMAEEESLYNTVEPRAERVLCDQELKLHKLVEGNDMATATMAMLIVQKSPVASRICRPPYHYMYMVRKVPATRALPIKDNAPVTASATEEISGDDGERATSEPPTMTDGNRSCETNGVRVAKSATECSSGSGCDQEEVDVFEETSGRRSMQQPPTETAVDVDVAAEHLDSEVEKRDYRETAARRRHSNVFLAEETKDHLRNSSREHILISSADFENWYLKKKVERCVSSGDCQESGPKWPDNGALNQPSSLVVGDQEYLNEVSARKPISNSSSPSSSTTKRARRNSTGQIAVQLSLNRAVGSGMNLQSSGQTAAVGKGYLPSSAHPQNSLSGECPWFLQNPGAALNPPPTAPLRQHKRPAPQPGTQFTHPSHNLLGHNQNPANNTTQHHLLSGPHPTTISELQKPNSIAIQHQQTYQSAVQHSPKSPIQICPSGMGGVGGPNSGGGLIGGHLPPPSGGLMSTSLNSAHLSNHGLQTQAIASNLSPASSSQSSLHNHSPGGSLLSGTVANHNNAAMSTSLHGGMGGGSGGGHSPANNSNLNSLGVNSSSSTSGLSSNLGVGPNVNGPISGSTWPSGNSSLSPTTQQHAVGAAVAAAVAGGGPPPLLQRKCEVKLNAMPWFHGSISRDEAEHLLQPREDGLFLVRESTNFPGDYTLCVCFQGKVEHYRVKYLENKLTIDDEEYFENLGQLVQHYEKDADGLCTQLIKSLPKKGRQDFCINSKDFLDRGWVIPESDLQLRESIGKGEFGDVMLGILRNERVAVKVLKDEGAAQKFLTEASVMTTLEHENLVKFIGLVFSSKHIYLVTEYMSKGSLVDYLRSRGRQHITRKDQINFACDTCSGMEYLEAKKVVHRDLAARNVLIAENCIAKVADFGLAREECYNLDVGKLPIKWTAPEALKGGRFSNKSDMWSFGILLWEIYSFGRVPYPRIPLADVVKHVEVGYKMEAPEGCPSEIYEMMRQAWDLNPSRRPTFADLKVKLLQLKSITT